MTRVRKMSLIFAAIVLCLPLLASTVFATGMPTVFASSMPSEKSAAECLAVIEASSNRLLYAKNENKRRPMASCTKILTAITVIENERDLSKIICVPPEAVGVEGSSIYLMKNEKVSVLDLLYGLMLQSGNDCAEALAIVVGGNRAGFAEKMNALCEKIGAKNSHFVTPHGLHDDNHYTTAQDLAIISSYAMKNTIFQKIVATKKHIMPWEGRDYPRVILNKNKILNTYDGGNGIKTGYTKKAGRCLVSSATRNGMTIIAVALNCSPMFEQCALYMDKAFSEYSLVKVCDSQKVVGNVAVADGKVKSVGARAQKDLYYPLRKGEEKAITCDILPENIVAPIKNGANIGKIKIYLSKQLLFDEKLISIESVNALSILDKLKDIVNNWNE